MKKYLFSLLGLLILVACGSQQDNRAPQNIESRPVEQMSQREASLLGLDLKDGESQDGWPTWAGPKIYSMQEAQQLAAETGRKVLVEIYAVWCGYCRKMAAETYPDRKVREKVDEYFYMVRLNAESDRKTIFNGEEYTEAELSAAFGVSSFPTTIFVDTNGDPLGMQPGYMDADIYRNLISYVGSNAYRTTPFDVYISQQNP